TRFPASPRWIPVKLEKEHNWTIEKRMACDDTNTSCIVGMGSHVCMASHACVRHGMVRKVGESNRDPWQDLPIISRPLAPASHLPKYGEQPLTVTHDAARVQGFGCFNLGSSPYAEMESEGRWIR